jgi:hypothetical protein
MLRWSGDGFIATIEEFAANGYTHVSAHDVA